MGLNHLALATKDLDATHRFYTEVMGFDLVKVVAAKTDGSDGDGPGWSKHVFYDCGDGSYIAFWDLHDERIPEGYNPAISKGLGLPTWVNHIAFKAEDTADLDRRRTRWTDAGYTVSEVDHEWVRSVYTLDPNGNLVEFVCHVRELDENDRAEAQRLLADPNPPLEDEPAAQLHRPTAVAS